MARLPPKHAEKREAALRANLLKRKEQAREQAGGKPGKHLPGESPPAKDDRR